MTDFTVHNTDTAPEAARPILESTQKAFGGMIPNLYGGVPEAEIESLRTGAKLSDPKHEALRRFTAHMVQARGWAEPAEIGAFLAVGYTQENILDVILGIGQKTLSNYTNHIADTPVDPPFQSAAWSAELKAAAGGQAA